MLIEDTGLPTSSVRISGGTPPGPVRDAGQVGGRLILEPGGLSWQPSARVRKSYGFASVPWDKSWSIQLERVWGPGQQGHLTLRHPDGRVVHLWVRNREDLRMLLAAVH